jgi:valyl-tRNA synthetase
MVRDEKGEKMSKTRGNVIDPLDVTQKHGADALRFTLASMAGQGRDIKLSQERIAGHRAFANKIWNAARFVLMNAEGYDPQAKPASVYDRWILSRFQRCADEARAAMEEYRLSDATNAIYKFVWNELCDWAIELAKPALYGEKTPTERAGAQAALLTALEGALRLLHPFMPFVTEEIWQRLPNKRGETIMLAPYPPHDPRLLDPEAEREMDLVARAIDGARSVRGEVNLPPNQRVPLVLIPRDEEARAALEMHSRAFQHLANAAPVALEHPGAKRPRQAAVHVEPEVEVHLPLAGLIDFAAEKARVEKELARLEQELAGIRKRLDNAGFVERAPAEVVEKDRARSEELKGKREKLARHLTRITGREEGMEEKNPQHPQQGGSSTSQGPGQQLGSAAQSVGHAVEEKAKEMFGAAKEAMAPMERVAEQIAQAATSAAAAVAERVSAAGQSMAKRTAKAVAKRVGKRKAAKKAKARKAAPKKAKKKAAPRKAKKSARKKGKK